MYNKYYKQIKYKIKNRLTATLINHLPIRNAAIGTQRGRRQVAASARTTGHRECVSKARGVGTHERILELSPEGRRPPLERNTILEVLLAGHFFKRQSDELDCPELYWRELTQVRKNAIKNHLFI